MAHFRAEPAPNSDIPAGTGDVGGEKPQRTVSPTLKPGLRMSNLWLKKSEAWVELQPVSGWLRYMRPPQVSEMPVLREFCLSWGAADLVPGARNRQWPPPELSSGPRLIAVFWEDFLSTGHMTARVTEHLHRPFC